MRRVKNKTSGPPLESDTIGCMTVDVAWASKFSKLEE